MSRYIEAEWLKELYKPYQSYNGKELAVPIGAILANIDDAPSIDIVFCKACKYWHKNRKAGDGMNVFDICYDFQADDFCSYGEREGE